MKRTLATFTNSRFRRFVSKHAKYAPLMFFVGGFIFDSLTLGRIDRLYDLVVLCSHMLLLTITIWAFNLTDDGRWKGTLLERVEEYFPLAIQFFFGGLSSAYVIYFSRSVSLSKTASFFVILVILLVANEYLKNRISNKYLQFGLYSFVSFTFFAFMTPVFLKQMDTTIFVISGIMSFLCCVALVTSTYKTSPSTRKEVHLGKLLSLIVGIFLAINAFYFLKLIPPVPLALDVGIVAHNVVRDNGNYRVTFEPDDWLVFWRKYRYEFVHDDQDPVYVYSSIFAPTDFKLKVIHRWQWYNPNSEEWDTVDDIGYDITGGRDEGFRGFTFKNNVTEGKWKVQVITEEELVIGVIDFVILPNDTTLNRRIVERVF